MHFFNSTDKSIFTLSEQSFASTFQSYQDFFGRLVLLEVLVAVSCETLTLLILDTCLPGLGTTGVLLTIRCRQFVRLMDL